MKVRPVGSLRYRPYAWTTQLVTDFREGKRGKRREMKERQVEDDSSQNLFYIDTLFSNNIIE
jgi:hypothetical protein